MTEWKELPEGYYAVRDPRPGVEEMTYWRARPGRFGSWPKKARYGPSLTKDDLPEDVDPRSEEGQAFIREWGEREHEPYWRAVVETIASVMLSRIASLRSSSRCRNSIRSRSSSTKGIVVGEPSPSA